MQNQGRFRSLAGGALLAAAVALLTSAKAPSPELAKYKAAERLVAKHIATFDTLDPGTYYVKELSAPSSDYTFDPNHVVGPIVVGFRETKAVSFKN